ncbi:MAG: hypothetical protein ACXVJB_04895 [Mucilaginibacter sp.]
MQIALRRLVIIALILLPGIVMAQSDTQPFEVPIYSLVARPIQLNPDEVLN